MPLEASSTKFLLHSDSFSERGDSVTVMAISDLLKEELGVESVIAIPADSEKVSISRLHEAKVRGLEVFRYRNKTDLELFVKERGVTHTYVFSGGRKVDLPYYDTRDPDSFRIGDTVHITHVVFRNLDVHGDVYAFVSEWLFEWAKPRLWSKKITNRFLNRGSKDKTVVASFPHFINSWPRGKSGEEFRIQQGIPLTARLIGRIGGRNEFSDPAARKAIAKVLEQNQNTYALFVNTERFLDHPRAIFVEQLNRPDVGSFYRACDVLINGRRMGESFGYSIAEPLHHGLPVLAPHWLRNPFMDRNQIKLLKGLGLLYLSSSGIIKILNRLEKNPPEKSVLRARVSALSRGNAAKLFSSLLSQVRR
jgi:hypothetical protein